MKLTSRQHYNVQLRVEQYRAEHSGRDPHPGMEDSWTRTRDWHRADVRRRINQARRGARRG